MQQLEIKKSIRVNELKDVMEIKEALNKTLYIPDARLKPKIIEKLIKYLSSAFSDETHKVKVFTAYNELEVCGFVVAQIHPTYTSYGRKCGTFGWLNASSFEVCKELIRKCEEFVKRNKVRRIRGNVNFPKRLGGVGIQVLGFEQQMMHGVAFNDPKTKLIDYLENLGYAKESEYVCMHVNKKTWEKGKRVDKSIKLGYLTLKELIERKDEILEIGKNSFHSVLPDGTGGESGLNEMISIYSQVPASYYKLKDDFNPRTYSTIPEFVEAWESCDLEQVVTWVPMAFDRKKGELVGAILSLPDLYQLWLGEPITRVNVDTAMVKKSYAGMGIFSALNNIGQLTCRLNGVDYIEGTGIWANNKDAINSIFPHCEFTRKFFVLEKRIRSQKKKIVKNLIK